MRRNVQYSPVNQAVVLEELHFQDSFHTSQQKHSNLWLLHNTSKQKQQKTANHTNHSDKTLWFSGSGLEIRKTSSFLRFSFGVWGVPLGYEILDFWVFRHIAYALCWDQVSQTTHNPWGKIVAHCPTLCIDGAWLNTLHNIAMPTDFINALCSPRSFRLHRLSNAQMTTPSRGFCCASYHKKRVGRCGGQIFTMFFLFFLALFCV